MDHTPNPFEPLRPPADVGRHEWDDTLAAVEGIGMGTRIAELTDEDVGVLAGRLALPAEQLQAIRAAARNSHDVGMPTEVLYALQRMNIGSALDDLVERDRDEIVAAISDAVEARIVPPIDDVVVDRLITRVELGRAGRQPLEDAINAPDVAGTAELVRTLADRGIVSFDDLRSASGYRVFTDAAPNAPQEASDLVRAHVNLSLLATEQSTRAAVLDAGYAGIGPIARAPLEEFIETTENILDPLAATTMHTQAVVLHSLLKKAITEERINQFRGTATIDNASATAMEQARQEQGHPCECTDCESALSPLAYLADLLRYCSDYLRDTALPQHRQRVDYARLGLELHQRFADLPAECGAIEQLVPQVRLAIEVLRAHLIAHPASTQAAVALEAAEREYIRQTYELLLLRIGTSFSDVRLAASASAAEVAELAAAIGVRAPTGATDHVRDLRLDPSGPVAPFEAQLERLFGLKSTRTDPFAVSPEAELAKWRRDNLRDVWLEQDWPDDALGDGVPLIDPDVITPDDFRDPDLAHPAGAFEIWLRRRTFVDRQLEALLTVAATATETRFEAMLATMFATTGPRALPVYQLRSGASAVVAWLGTPAQFLAVADALASPVKVTVLSAISSLDDTYGLTVDAYQRLLALLERDRASGGAVGAGGAPTASERREFASILAQGRKRLHASRWVTEEQTAQASADPMIKFEFGPADFWVALTEPTIDEWPPVDDGRTPWIEPDIVRRSDLPDSAVGDRARHLWDTRLQELQAAQAQVSMARRHAFDDALAVAFGTLPHGLPASITTWGTFVDDTEQLLASGVAADVTTARTRLEATLFLSEEAFRQLMSIRSRDASPDLGNRPTTSEFDDADNTLVGAFKRRTLYGANAPGSWYAAERTGATSLADWQALKMRLDPWRASPEQRTAWKAAFRVRSRPPLIDPDVVDRSQLRAQPDALPAAPTAPEQVAAQLWDARRRELGDRVDAIRTARQGAANANDQGLSAALAAAASPPPFTRSDVQQLRTQRDAGASIQSRLDQLGLAADAFAFVNRIDEIVAAGQRVTATEWAQLYDVLVQVRKRRTTRAWGAAERQAGISLGPDCFVLTPPDETVFPPPLPPDPPLWRATDEQRQAWTDLLQARTDQSASLGTSLAAAVGEVESITLPVLRDALIVAVPNASLPPADRQVGPTRKAKVLARQLLIDLEMAGCATTTRVSQAIDTIQDLLFSVRNGFLEGHPSWQLTTLAGAAFDEIWQWLGSYATWRAAMFVLLYPENLLVPTLRRERSWGFSNLLRDLRNAGDLAGGEAAAATDGFVAYFRDVCELDISAGPLVDSRFVDEQQSVALELAPSGKISTRFLIGLAPTSRQVYWSIVHQGRQGQIQSTWRPLTAFELDVVSIIGATIYRTPDGRRFLYVFALTNRDGEDHVDFARFDLEREGRWSPAEAETLDLGGETHLSSVVLLSTADDVPPAVRTTNRSGAVRDFQLGVKGTASNVSVITAGAAASWSTVFKSPQLNDVPGYGNYRLFGGLALRRGSLATRYDLVFFELLDGQTRADWIFGGVRVIRGIGSDGAPPAGNQGGFTLVGDRQPAPNDHLPTTAWSFGNSSQRSVPVGCAIALGDVDNDQKDDLVMVYLVSDSIPANPATMYCRVGLGLNDDGSCDQWLNASAAMLSALPGNPGPSAATILGRSAGRFELLVAGTGDPQGHTIWLRAITVELQAGGLAFSNVRTGPSMTVAGKVGGLGIGIADVDGDGVGDLLVQWTEQDTNGNQTASKLTYGPRVDPNGFPTQAWQQPNDVLPAFYQGGAATWSPGAAGMAVGNFSGAPGRVDALIASFPQRGSDEWRYIIANSLNLQLSPGSASAVSTARYKPFLATSLVPAAFDFRIGAARSFAPNLAELWSRNSNKTRINQVLIEEAAYFAPLAVALQLQQSTDFLAALDWFRTVFDYVAPPSHRQLYPGLEPNPGGPTVWRDMNWAWLRDPLDPHSIAQGRPGTYRLFTIQAEARCLLAYADAEFTLDTSESITLARTLYLEVLDLLDADELRQMENGCAEVREWILFAIGELPAPDPAVSDDIYEIVRSHDAAVLKTAATALAEAHSTGKWSDSVADQLHSAARTATAVPEVPETLQQVMVAADRSERAWTQAFFSDADHLPETAALLAGTAGTIGRLFEESFGAPYGPGMFDSPLSDFTIADGLVLTIASGDHIADPMDGGIIPLDGGTVGGMFTQFVETLGDRALDVVPSAPLVGDKPGSYGYQPPKFSPVPDMLTISACVPPNPVLKALRLRAELNLYKIRTCRSITGEHHQVEPYAAATDSTSGMPSIGLGGQLVVPGLNALAPTPYRSAVLLERAKNLVQLAYQNETAMFAAIQAGDTERYTAFKAQQDLESAKANVKLQTIRVTEADSTIVLTQLQRDRAQLEIQQYSDWLQGGTTDNEKIAVTSMWVAFGLYAGLTVSYTSAAIAAAATGVGAALAAQLAASAAQSGAQASQQLAQIYQFWQAHDEKRQSWIFQRNLAQQDRKLAEQQYYIAQDQKRVVLQEQTIASLTNDHASAVIEFLSRKFTNTDLYDWMADVLGGVYRYFLQHATATARLGAAQLAFERQEPPPPFIRADYWKPPSDNASSDTPVDRRGLTGSMRLLQDITQLEEYALASDSRKLQLSKTISLVQLAPIEFQQFRETGVLSFSTPMSLFDRDFPGQYLRLVHRVRVSVLALTPPGMGIRATLRASRLSRVVIGGDVFQTVRVSHGPDMVALSSARESDGLFDLDPQPTMLAPLENIGVDTTWELRMPRASNPFDFNTIGDVLFTIDYTALHSFDYQQQVVAKLGRRVTAQRGWSLRYQLADQWYELNNPDLSATPMTVRFTTSEEDFPPNVEPTSLSIDNIALHVVTRPGVHLEIPRIALRFRPTDSTVFVGGTASTIDGTISTASGSAGSWIPMQARVPIGEWELGLPNTDDVRSRVANGDLVDLMLVVTFSGRLPAWPTS